MREDEAKQILMNNNRGGYTIPSSKLYPFQWNWDSGFISLGLNYYDIKSAEMEIINMFKGQWKTGLLPHINFHQPNGNYFPGPDAWGTRSLQQVSENILTSGITQPPVFGFILSRIAQWQKDNNHPINEFLKIIFPKIMACHRYLYTHRDPYNEGLVYIQHNWESGMDNSPIWDDILESIDAKVLRDVSSLRKDNKKINPSERPTNDNYNRYIYLVDLFSKLKYNDEAISKESPFLVQDVLFNSLLVKSNHGLIAIAKQLGSDTSEIEEWNKRTINGINSKLWDRETGFFFPYDIRNKKLIKIKTISGFMPLFAEACNKEKGKRVVNHLTTSFIENQSWGLCPTTAANEKTFDPVKYWRGPIWINLNWMLFHGLKTYGYEELANRIKKTSLDLINQFGMYEYFDARLQNTKTATGLGSDSFSWTAALYLDFLHNNQPL